MKKSSSAWLLAIVVAFAAGTFTWDVSKGIICAAVVFYVWGMAKAHQVLEQRFRAACHRSPWMMTSEGVEAGYMVWFWLSWPIYLLARQRPGDVTP